MKKLFSAGGLLLFVACAGAGAVLAAQNNTNPQQPASTASQSEHADWEMPKPTAEHLWLKRLVGEWETDATFMVGPDQQSMTSKGTDSVRALGDFWTLANMKGDMAGDQFEGVMTLGYDAEKNKYIGTWVDSMTSYMWKYEGTLDATKNKLTLETEGPSPEGGSTKWRETIEFKNDDHRVFTSSMQGSDGQWVTLLTVHMHRKN